MTVAQLETVGAVVIAKSSDFVVVRAGQQATAAPAAQPVAAPQSVVAAQPSGWQALHDPASGRTYYFNAATSETSWEVPALVASTPPSSAPASAEFDAHVDSAGRTYYHNPATNETTWQLPAGAVLR